MPTLPFRSARQLASEIRRKRIGALELLELYLARVERYNPRLNAIIATDLDAARKRARAADRALARGEVRGPLHGVPMTIKESFDVVGMPTTWGLPELKDNFPARNALVVDRLLAAGAVVFGKTNVPLLLADWQSFNAIYGTTNNPWDPARVPGGSSGGSAAALAAGLTALEAGSDIGASIRNPAHYCGVYGHKPTYGIVPLAGHALPGTFGTPDIAVAGPLARSADDLALALEVIAGADAIDGTGWRLALPAPRRRALREYRVAVMLDDPSARVDREVQDRLQTLADFLGRKRAKVSDRARPAGDTAEADRVYVMLLRAATSGRQTPEEFEKNLETARGLAPADESYVARMVRANTMYHKDWLAWNNARHRMRLAWAGFFQEWDLLLCPAAASAAFPHDHAGERYERTIRVNGKDVPTTDQLFWAGYPGMAYLPSTVAPCGFTPGGLPVGVQIVGPQYGDRACIAFARLLEREFQGFVAPPGYEA
ncbi:MAG TPA: amidase [Candidatus Rokubacteria bacterium]|nr:MAG: amidase [Candidatus Rokubacteria bacterium GWA2_73_35]HBH02301.1 amidase [Candidatus Rokubacteria bacterium]